MKNWKILSLAVGLSAVFCSYSYSEEVTGTTPNAAANGFTWNMFSVLPPQAGLTFNGMFYQYTTEKNTEDDFTVTIQNRDLLNGGYVIQETDDWSGLPGATINKRVDLPNIPQSIVGEGSIVTTGTGEVKDPSVVYSFRYDECYLPISNPECPGYEQALYDYLLANGLLNKEPDINDPFYDEWVQFQLNRENEFEEETDDEKKQREETLEVEEDRIEKMNAEVDINKFVDGAKQNEIIQSFSTIPNFEIYTQAAIDGGVYRDTVQLQDATLLDNSRALRQFATDEVHKKMVRSQYEK